MHPSPLRAVLAAQLEEAGGKIETGRNWISLDSEGQPAEGNQPAYCALPCLPEPIMQAAVRIGHDAVVPKGTGHGD